MRSKQTEGNAQLNCSLWRDTIVIGRLGGREPLEKTQSALKVCVAALRLGISLIQPSKLSFSSSAENDSLLGRAYRVLAGAEQPSSPSMTSVSRQSDPGPYRHRQSPSIKTPRPASLPGFTLSQPTHGPPSRLPVHDQQLVRITEQQQSASHNRIAGSSPNAPSQAQIHELHDGEPDTGRPAPATPITRDAQTQTDDTHGEGNFKERCLRRLRGLRYQLIEIREVSRGTPTLVIVHEPPRYHSRH